MMPSSGAGPRRVLVTGGAGFIGAHLVRALLETGDEITVVDNLSRGRRQALPEDPRVRLLIGDIADPAFLTAAVRPWQPQLVYHLAAIHYIPECLAHPAEALRVNVAGTRQVLEAIRTPALQRAVLASSGAVYAPSNRPVTERDAVGPMENYGTSKLAAEALWRTAAQAMPQAVWLVARLFNAYGPGETNPHLIPHLVQELKQGRTVRLGDLAARRDFTYVADIVSALVALGQLDGRFEIFNVGSGTAASVADVVRALEAALGESITITQEAARRRPVDRPFLCADTGRLTQATGWRARWTLRDGLRAWLEAEALLPRRGPGA